MHVWCTKVVKKNETIEKRNT